MMSRWGGGEGGCRNVTNTTDRLRECVTKGGRGSKKVENLRDVIYGWSLETISWGQLNNIGGISKSAILNPV